MRRSDRPSLKGCLDLTDEESSPLEENLRADYIVLRRINVRREYVYVEFVDGDVKDKKEWFEGPFPERMTIRALFEMRDEMVREERREVYGRKKLGDDMEYNISAGKESECDESPKSSDGGERAALNDNVESGSVNGESSEGTDKYVPGESSCAGPRSSAGTRERASCAMIENVAETRLIARKRTLRAIEATRVETSNEVLKTEVKEMDTPNRKVRRIESRSATMKGE